MADARVGRFAPSPTGPLHFGSLVAAVASYLNAKCGSDPPVAKCGSDPLVATCGSDPLVAKCGSDPLVATGRWHIRIEDLDPPRELPGASTHIITTLERFGFEWDGDVTYQSRNGDRYTQALERLQRIGAAYPCACSRREIADNAISEGPDGLVYPGTCRAGLAGKTPRALRVRTTTELVAFDDAVFGHIEQNLEALTGDYVVKRADGFWAYQLAVVVDDAADGVTEVVRGADLIDSTTRQIHLQRLLGLPTPSYAHVPVVLGDDGKKLSKSMRAAPLDAGHEADALVAALAFLGQQPPADLAPAGIDAVWRWAKANWALSSVPAIASSRVRP